MQADKEASKLWNETIAVSLFTLLPTHMILAVCSVTARMSGQLTDILTCSLVLCSSTRIVSQSH